MDEGSVIKVLALTGVFSSPSTRLRIIYMSKFLKNYGIDIKIIKYPKNIFDIIKALNSETYDLIWLQKRMPDFFKYIVFKFNKKPVIFDFDDNLIVRMKPKNGSFKSKTRDLKFNLVKKMSTGFTCGNNFLSNLIKDTNKPYFIYPTPVPVNVKIREFKKLQNPIIVGWIGLSGGFMYLDRILPQLKKLYDEVNFKLKIISDKDYKSNEKFVVNIRWKLDTQEEEISKFDFGIMPLNTSSPYDKGKCAYKVLQYMASGVIPVAEAYGTNVEIIEHGENGFLIYNNNWYNGLKDIFSKIRNGIVSYEKISDKAKKTAKEKYSFEAIAPYLAEFFKNFYEERRDKKTN